MNTKIATRERFTALCRINRWGGWTKRPYSVGEHTAIGAWVANWFKFRDDSIHHWWMHDMHETEIVGDVTTPQKHLYMNEMYFTDVADFDRQLGLGLNFRDGWWGDATIKRLDRKMLLVENDLIAVNPDPELPAPDYTDALQKEIRSRILGRYYTCPDAVIDAYNRDAKMKGWVEI